MEKQERRAYRLMGIISSGNAVVDEVQKIVITGNIVSPVWYKTILYDSGKPDHLAISILSDIVYWYKPVEVRDEASGHLVGWRTKFKSDMYQKSYDSYAEFYGESKRSVKAAIDRLVELGIVIREFRTVDVPGGMRLFNVMFLSLDPEVLRRYTETGPGSVVSTSGHNDQKLEKREAENGEEPVNHAGFVGGPTLGCTTPYNEMYDGLQQNVVPPAFGSMTPTDKTYAPIHSNVSPPTSDCMTNTEITTENTTEITSTSPAPFDDESVRAVFAGLNLNDHDICCIISASEDNLEKCRKAVEALKKQKTKISNVTGWLINAVRQNFEVSNWVGYKPRNNQAGSFGNFQQREIDFDELYKRVYAN